MMNLSSRAKLKAVKVAEGESLALAVWHPSFNYSAGATLSDYEINPATAANITAMEAALKAYQAAVQTGLTSTALPLVPLAKSGTAQNKLGTFSLAGWANRDKFPNLSETAPATGQNTCTVEGAKGLSIKAKADSLDFATRGRTSSDKSYDWMPVLQFKPQKTGTYALSGQLKLSGKKSKNPEKPDAVSFAVFKIKGTTVTPIAQKPTPTKPRWT